MPEEESSGASRQDFLTRLGAGLSRIVYKGERESPFGEFERRMVRRVTVADIVDELTKYMSSVAGLHSQDVTVRRLKRHQIIFRGLEFEEKWRGQLYEITLVPRAAMAPGVIAQGPSVIYVVISREGMRRVKQVRKVKKG